MSTYRTESIAAGILFITATTATMASFALTDPVLSGADVAGQVADQQSRVIVGALLETINALASAGIAMALFPIIWRHVQGGGGGLSWSTGDRGEPWCAGRNRPIGSAFARKRCDRPCDPQMGIPHGTDRVQRQHLRALPVSIFLPACAGVSVGLGIFRRYDAALVLHAYSLWLDSQRVGDRHAVIFANLDK